VRDRLAGKPLDVGTGSACASLTSSGNWLSVGCLHPWVGFVELSGGRVLDEAGRGDPSAARAWRAGLSDPAGAFLTIRSSGGEPARASWALAGVEAGRGGITQVWRFDRRDGEVVVRLAGRLDRPALAEITEINPPIPTGARSEIVLDGRRATLRSRELPAVATVDVSSGTWVAEAGESGTVVVRLPAANRDLTITVSVAPGTDVPALVRFRPDQAPAVLPPPGSLPGVPVESTADDADRIVERALAYVRGCTALEFAPGERAFLTDHRILPLSWTRDAYYQALLLLAADDDGDRDRVADHLRWLWRRCRRPGGRWARSHHGNGEPKDLAFQADQQLYPLVELADFHRLTGRLPDGVDWQTAVPGAWSAALAALDPTVGLIGSDENAADDRAELPFIAASQILLWYTARRLAEAPLATELGLSAPDLQATASNVRRAFDRYLVHDGRWAYATDGRGRAVDYHDANDLPTAFAPAWGFCRPDDPAWRATVDFAFSTANPAFVPGANGGLGSAHTPGCWTLGDVQAWLVARVRDDAAAATAAIRRLEAAAFADGMLPEAYAVKADGVRRIRQWFAWPGSAFGALRLLDRTGGLDRLSVR
jgi:hypothetical protein